jgi:hypothetical protein
MQSLANPAAQRLGDRIPRMGGGETGIQHLLGDQAHRTGGAPPQTGDKEIQGPDARSRSTTTRSRWGSASTFLRSRGTSMIIANIEDYRKQCEARLPPFLYDYISGGSFQENTLRANVAELQATLLRQRVMVDESHLNLSIQKAGR